MNTTTPRPGDMIRGPRQAAKLPARTILQGHDGFRHEHRNGGWMLLTQSEVMLFPATEGIEYPAVVLFVPGAPDLGWVQDLQARLDAVLALHNSGGFRYFGRLPGQAMPDPEGESYCTHCNKPAPCPSMVAATGMEVPE